MSTLPFRAASALAALVAASLLFTTAADAQQRQRQRAAPPAEVAVVNRAASTLQYLYVTPVDEANWGDDRLGSETVRPGARFSFRLQGAQQCRFDVRALYENGVEETRLGANLCQRAEIMLTGRAPTSTAGLARSGPIALFVVRNRTSQTLQVLRLTDANGQEGEDILGATVIEAGHSYTGRFARSAGCNYGVVATFAEGGDRNIPPQNLCQGREVVFDAETPAGQPGAPQAQQGEQIEFSVVNRSSVVVQYLYVRPTGSGGWGRDRLGNETIAARDAFTVRMPRGRSCQYDIRAVFDNNQENVTNGVDLCENREHVVSGPALATGRGDRKQRPDVRAGRPVIVEMAVVNEGANPIESLFISSSRLSTWGDDMLNGSRIAVGARYVARVERDDQCNFDFRIVYQGGREERRMRHNICERRELAFGGPNAFRIDGGGPDNGRRVVLTNSGRTVVREVFLTPTRDTHWGDDRLGRETMAARFRLELRLPEEGGCNWDLRVVYEGGQSMERRDQDLCANPELAIGRQGRPGTVASTGTGFYISATGHVLTNHHVVDGCATVAISRPGGQRVPLRLIGADEGADLAVLVEEGATSLPLAFRNSQGVRAGERVVLVGYPARSQLGGVNVTEGIVSGLRGALGDQTRFQYTAPTQPGNSGGPVLDASGLVVGVVVSQIDKISGERTAQNINFGIKLDLIRTFLAANGVTMQDRANGEAMQAADILQNADASVLPLDCLE
ncbi:S1 family peptidase [Phreatobacter sp.]|uniref:S1 family peptidase n=1 Tax=Phreatobacter sp. TaxID=1966341 RepID=UPI003F703B8D